MGRTSIVLVVVALSLLGFIWFFERGSVSTTERELRKGRVLDSFVRERVTRVELQHHGVSTVLVKVPPNPNDALDIGGWQVEAPFKAKADSIEVDGLLGTLEWAETRRSLGAASAKDLKQFGLDAPRYRVRFVAGREEGGFNIGASAADGGGAYLQPKGSNVVYVVGSELLEALQHEPVDFHAKTLNEGLSALTTEHIELSGAERPTRKLTKKEGFVWLEAPIATLASASEVKTFVDGVDSMKASRYVAEQLKPEYGLAQPRLSIDLDSLVYDAAHKGERHTERFSLRVGATCSAHSEESYIQVGQSSVYCASNAELTKLDKAPEQLRETRVMPLDADAISGVVLRDKDRELSLSTADNVTQYKLTQAGKVLKSGTADADALKHWYGALREQRFSGFQPLDSTQRAAIELTGNQATFNRSSKDEAPYTLHLDAAKQKATRLNEASLLELPPAALPLLTPTAARYRDMLVLNEDESQLAAISVSGAGTPTERVEKHGTDYEVVTPQRAAAARAPLDELARLFSKLEVVSFEADVPRADQGLAAPYRVLKVEYGGAADSGKDKAKPRAHTLKIGAKANDHGRYAQLDDDSTVFVVSNAIASKLDGSLAAPLSP
jgi:hypothetical protein